jgi:hypothetical protein
MVFRLHCMIGLEIYHYQMYVYNNDTAFDKRQVALFHAFSTKTSLASTISGETKVFGHWAKVIIGQSEKQCVLADPSTANITRCPNGSYIQD